MLKVKSFKLDETDIKAMSEVCELAGISQANFIRNAIHHYIDELATTASGGMYGKIPSPYIYQSISQKDRNKIIDLLNETNYKFTKIAGGKLDLGLNEIKQFAEYRLNPVNEERDKAKFLKAFDSYNLILNNLEGGK